MIYIYNILVLRKIEFTKYMGYLIDIFYWLHIAGLKYNTHKWGYVFNYNTYLVYIINQDGIKTGLKELQVIMNIEINTNKMESKDLISIV